MLSWCKSTVWFISLFLSSSVFAATVSVVAEKSMDNNNPGGGTHYIYFDASNQLHIGFQVDSAKAETKPTSDGTVMFRDFYKTHTLEVVSTQTGAVISSITHLPDTISDISAAIYDGQNQIVYLTTDNYQGDYNRLFKINLKSGEYTQLTKLPRQSGFLIFKGIPARTQVLLLTPDKKYLILLASISSRVNGHDVFMVYDLENSKWIYEKEFGSGHGGQLILGEGNNIGLYYYDQSENKLMYSHYLIT